MQQKKFVKITKKSDNNIADIIQSYKSNPNDIDLNEKDGNSKSLIHHAAIDGNIDVLTWLVLQNSDINSQTKNHSTPLHFAIQKKKFDLAAALIMLNADLTIEKTTKNNKNVFSPPRYTSDPELIAGITALKNLHQELSKIRKDPRQSKLNELPEIKKFAPTFLKKLADINIIDGYQDLGVFLQRHPTLSNIHQLIQNDAEAKQRYDDTVVHDRKNAAVIKVKREKNDIKYTPSLKLDDEKKDLVKSNIESARKIKLLKDEIIFHQQTRLQLAFYLFIAYYKSRIQLTYRDTDEQEGQGSGKKGTLGATAACHIALIKGVTEQFRWKAGCDPEQLPHHTRSNSEDHKTQLKTSHYFYHLIASTTNELPEAVNWYDGRLEGKTTIGGAAEASRELFQLLQKVSLGTINPIQALETFTIALVKPNGILEHVRKKADFKKELKSAPFATKKLIHRYIVEATKEALTEKADGSFSFKRCHIANLLFMPKAERTNIAEWREDTLQQKCEPYFIDLQNEIKSHHIQA